MVFFLYFSMTSRYIRQRRMEIVWRWCFYVNSLVDSPTSYFRSCIIYVTSIVVGLSQSTYAYMLYIYTYACKFAQPNWIYSVEKPFKVFDTIYNKTRYTDLKAIRFEHQRFSDSRQVQQLNLTLR